MRAPPPPPPPGQPSTGFQGIGGGGGAGGVGVVRMENLDAASRQLARNAAYGKHGPGVCTAAAAHSKFIAVGTSRGLILLFDHFQARCVCVAADVVLAAGTVFSCLVVVVVVVFTLKKPSRSRLYPVPPSVSTSISVLILSLNTVNFRGHKLTYL